MNELHALLEKAARSIDAAEVLLEKGHLDFAASRAYYACFYAAEALLLSRGLEFSSHGQVLAQYGRHFSKTRALDPAYHTLLANAFDLRHLADYQTEVPIKLEVVLDVISGGRRFLKAAADYLETLPEAAEGGRGEP
jgi:uncharacterized protein (UPF0332 family)